METIALSKKITNFSEFKSGSLEDLAFGTILGAFTGDACGSFNEFNEEIADEEFMDECMKMPGGGPFKLEPGCVTDDSELAMSQLSGIVI